MSQRSLNLYSDETAGVLASFAIVAPLLLFISLIGLEFSRSFKYVEVATMLSREAASMGYRMCSAETDGAIAKECLMGVRERIEDFGDNIFVGTDVLISLYRYIGDPRSCDGQVQRVALAAEDPSKTRITFISGQRAGSHDRIRGEINKELVCKNRLIITGEVRIPFKSLVGIIPRFFSYNPEEFYELAIM